MKKTIVRRIIGLLLISIPLIVVLGLSCTPRPSLDYRGRLYAVGTSITCGALHHDSDHRTYGRYDEPDHSYLYWFDYHMGLYNVWTNLSDWYQNVSYGSSWDVFNLGVGGGQQQESGMTGLYLAEVPSVVNGTRGRADWRVSSVDWKNISYLIVEGGNHELTDYRCLSCLPMIEQALNRIYIQSRYYGYSIVLIGMLPCSRAYIPPVLIEEVNRVKQEFVRDHPDVLFVDVFNSSFIQWRTDGDWCYNSTLFEDGIHPNLLGYRYLGSLVADVVYSDIARNHGTII